MLAEFGVTYDDLFAVYDAVRQAPGALLRTTRAEKLRAEITVVNADAARAMMDHFSGVGEGDLGG
jgi:hypothetical protein